jgi:hypothetical protein
MFFARSKKSNLWVTNSSKQNTEVMMGSFLFFIICYFLYPNLIINFSIVAGLTLF